MSATKYKRLEGSEESVRKLAAFGCTYEEIANITGLAKDTLTVKYKDIIREGHDEMKMSLRRERLRIALDPNHKQQATMLIFLSKTVLGDKEYAVIDDGLKAPKIRIEFVE